MADVKHKLSELLAELPVGVEDANSAQDLRNVVVSAMGSRRVDTITADTTITTDHDIVLINAVSANVSAALAAASGLEHKIYTFKRVDSSSNTAAVTPNGSDTIDGSSPFDLSSQYQFITIVSNGTNWYIIAKS